MGLESIRSEASKKSERKLEKKLEFYTKVRETVATLSAKKTIEKKNRRTRREKKLKAYDLSALSEFLPELKEPKKPAPPPKFAANSKSRQELVLKEAKQLEAVLKLPVFQSDPFAAIHEHLQSTQPPMEEKKPVKQQSSKNKRKKKGKKSKSSSNVQSMEM